MKINFKFSFLLVIIAIASFDSIAQSVEGDFTVNVNSTQTYYVADDIQYFNPYWVVSNGSMISQWQSTAAGAFRYNVRIKWDVVGTGTLTLYDGYTQMASADVDVSCTSGPATPSVSFSITSSLCAPRTITYTGSPPSGVTWYWQTSSYGTDTYNSSNSLIVNNGGTYAVRAVNTSGCWSNYSAEVNATVYQPPATPPAPTEGGNTCGAKTIYRANPPAGITYYWQGTTYNGTSTADASPSYPVYSTGTYYIRAYNNSTGCWSLTISKSVTIYDPPTPTTPTTTSYSCGPQQLNISGTPGTNIVWYWQGTNSAGTSTANSATYYSANVSGTNTYYIRGYNTFYGCWGASSSVVATVNLEPSIPYGSIGISTNTCGPKTLTRNTSPPAGEVWHWQGTNPSGTTINSSTTFIAPISGLYHLRSQKTSNGCWSVATQSIYVDVIEPATPNNPITTTNSCGNQTLSFNGSPPAGVQWFWQGTNSNGTNSAFPASTSLATVVGTATYYLRARTDSPTFCWSQNSASVVATVNAGPGVSNLPTVSSNTCGPKILTEGTTSGVAYFWQGTNSSGTDDTSPTATAPTYTVSSSGVYYTRAKSIANGCWGNSYGTNVTIDIPSAPANNTFSFCEWNPMSMTTSGFPVGGNLKWYTSTNTYLTTAITYSPTNVGLGTHVYHVKAVSTGGCESTGYATVTLNITNCDAYVNWSETSAYSIDGGGNPVKIASSRNYLDGFGKVMQAQSKSFTTNQVLASQPILDYLRQPAASTLAAPINSSQFAFKYRFVTNSSNQKYKPSDFDSNITSPNPVGSDGQGTLGWYYSSSNTMEPLTPTTAFPYSRSWSAKGPDPTLSKTAGPGEAHKMGSGHEVINERLSIAIGELDHYYSLRTHFVSTALPLNLNQGYKYITTDPDGKKSVVFNDADGKALATATINGGGGYENWSYVYYNDVGQVIGSVAPNGVNTGSSANPTFKSINIYDFKGNLIETTSTDEGTSKYMYNLRGQIRFSQNQLQRNENLGKFSYTNYDYLGRLTESGVYSPSNTALVFGSTTMETSLESTDITGITGTKSETNKIYYDVPGVGFTPDANHASQEFLYGQVSKTQNDNATTWYSYDEDGQLLWTKQSINGLGEKTIDYTYDFVGNVTQVAYQKGNPDAFYHHYTYDLDQRLTEVRTSLNGTSTTLRAKYFYYLHGPLKRVELGTDVQGIDYVYTITGALKGINHADDALDPGEDGDDLFGMTLNYYDNDYTGAGYSAGAQTLTGYPNQYGGAIKASSWHSAVDNQVKRTYAYTYDNLNQLTNAQFGNMTGSGGNYNFSGVMPPDPYKESISGYDKNGNIQGLTRRGKTGPLGNYGYVYTPSTNQLDKINDNGSLLVDYTHNAIGQMVEQTENGNTMKVSYNAYGIVNAIRDGSNVLQVSYHYDDGGNRIKNTYYEGGIASRNDFYVHDASGNVMAIYQQALPGGQPILKELPVYGAGRVAVYKPQVNVCFYELNDHLGNVRGVIGVPETDTYTATMETENMGLETQVFTNIDLNNIVPFVGANQTAGGNEVVRLNNSYRIGPSKSMKVSPGDVVDLEVYAYYEAASGYGSTSTTVAALVGAISGAFGGVMGGLGESGLIYNGVDDAIVATGVPTNPGDTRPAAYLEYILFDASYNFIARGWQVVPASANFAKQKIQFPASISITEPGYLFSYVSYDNESTNWVYFDELKITHTHSNIVAGADFYPFGLVMEGREITDEDYRFGYQGQYAEKDSVSGWNNFQLRMYDPRFGRWISPDPYGQFASPYVGMGNNPVLMTDRDGGFAGCPECDAMKEAGITVLDEVTVTASRIILEDGFKIWTSVGMMIEPKMMEPKRWSSPMIEAKPAEISKVFESPKITIDAELSYAPIEISSNGGLVSEAVRNARAPVGDFITSTMLMVGGPEVYLAKIVGAGVGALRGVALIHKHHVIPKAIYKELNLGKYGFSINHGLNLKKLPSFFHGNHPAYSNYVRQRIQQMGVVDIHKLKILQRDLRQEINDIYLNTGFSRLNDYYKTLGY